MVDDIKTKKQTTPDEAPSSSTNSSEPPFRTPEEIAQNAFRKDEVPLTGKPPKKKRFNLTKKQKIIIAVIIAILALGGGAAAWFMLRKEPPKQEVVEQKIEEPPKPTTEASKLTGLQVAPEVNKRQVTGIMIENSPDARPQSGLKDAGVVFEAIAEGGITRFLALYQDTESDYIGPVRSVRPYYLDWLVPFDAAVAHVGGSPEAITQIRTEGIKDLDQFQNAGAYQRISTRYAPHNVYTSIAQLDAAEEQRGYTTSTFTGFEHKEKETPLESPIIRAVGLTISSMLYNVHYDYDPVTNSYLRNMGGRPHVDERSGAPIAPKVVVALVMSRTNNGIYSVYGTNGSGKMYIFQDGSMVEGTWQKSDRKSQFVFTDSAGKPLKLNPGQAWVTIVSDPAAVNFGS